MTTNLDDLVDCRRCNGTGFIPDPEVWRSTVRVRSQRTCPDCHGVATLIPGELP